MDDKELRKAYAEFASGKKLQWDERVTEFVKIPEEERRAIPHRSWCP
jgi:hypothetical protein